MKLQGKKTGEIWENAKIATYSCGDKDSISVCQNAFAGQGRTYDSLAELNEEWEDYKPEEPLIKDEKIRKAVRAWAEANDFEPDYRVKYIADTFGFDSWKADINFNIKIEDLKDGEIYTIAELCGEEEE
jgi:hypothetical protein